MYFSAERCKHQRVCPSPTVLMSVIPKLRSIQCNNILCCIPGSCENWSCYCQCVTGIRYKKQVIQDRKHISQTSSFFLSILQPTFIITYHSNLCPVCPCEIIVCQHHIRSMDGTYRLKNNAAFVPHILCESNVTVFIAWDFWPQPSDGKTDSLYNKSACSHSIHNLLLRDHMSQCGYRFFFALKRHKQRHKQRHDITVPVCSLGDGSR